jgi:hypothetical protein
MGRWARRRPTVWLCRKFQGLLVVFRYVSQHGFTSCAKVRPPLSKPMRVKMLEGQGHGNGKRCRRSLKMFNPGTLDPRAPRNFGELHRRETPLVPTPSSFLMLHLLLRRGNPRFRDLVHIMRIRLLYCSLILMSGRSLQQIRSACLYMSSSQSPVSALHLSCGSHKLTNFRVAISKATNTASTRNREMPAPPQASLCISANRWAWGPWERNPPLPPPSCGEMWHSEAMRPWNTGRDASSVCARLGRR